MRLLADSMRVPSVTETNPLCRADSSISGSNFNAAVRLPRPSCNITIDPDRSIERYAHRMYQRGLWSQSEAYADPSTIL